MPLLTHDQRITVIALRDVGWTIEALTERFNVDKRTILRLSQRMRETGSTDDRPRKWSPCIVTTPCQNRILRRMSTEDPIQVVRTLRQRMQQEHGVDAFSRTIARRLTQMGLCGCVAKKNASAYSATQKSSVAWAREHQHWTVDDWRNVLFSVETPLNSTPNITN